MSAEREGSEQTSESAMLSIEAGEGLTSFIIRIAEGHFAIELSKSSAHTEKRTERAMMR